MLFADGERAAYVLEHLATFTVTRETGIVYPADGMRRLLQLEKTNGQYNHLCFGLGMSTGLQM